MGTRLSTGGEAETVRLTVARLAAAGCVLPDEEVRAALAEWRGVNSAELHRRLEDYATRREGGEPPAYILGGVRFLGAWVAVGPGAFIPRPWTEDVVHAALDLVESPLRVVDVGAGAGPISAALAARLPGAHVWAIESEPAALPWAHRNLDPLRNVTVLEGDLLEPMPPALRGTVDLVVGCLPYVPTAAVAVMPRDFRDHEPAPAFDGGPDGLAVVSRALEQAVGWLRPGGWIALEIGAGQGPAAIELGRRTGYGQVHVRPDAEGDDAMLAGVR